MSPVDTGSTLALIEVVMAVASGAASFFALGYKMGRDAPKK